MNITTAVISADFMLPALSNMFHISGSNLFSTIWSIVYYNVHRVQEKKRPQYSRLNFDKFSHSFV